MMILEPSHLVEAMEVRILGEFAPFGEDYIKKNPFSTDAIGKFDDIDLSAFIPNAPKPWGASAPKQSYRLTSSRDIEDDESHPMSMRSRKSNERGRLRHENENGFDEELYIVGSTVIWSQGYMLKKSFNFEDEMEPVLMALFAWFPFEETNTTALASSQNPPWKDLLEQTDAMYADRSHTPRPAKASKSPGGKAAPAASPSPKRKLQRALCVLLKRTAKIYFPSGLSYTVHLPFVVYRAWPLDVGILLQRLPETEELQPSSFGLPEVPPTAILFSLLDPFDEITMVSRTEQIIVAGTQHISIAEPTTPFTDHNHEVLFVSEGNRAGGTPVVVTFHREQMRHYVWRYATRPNEGDYPKEMTAAGRTLQRQPSIVASAAGTTSPSLSLSPIARRNSLPRANTDTSIVLDRVVHNDNVQSQQDKQMTSVTYLESVWIEGGTVRYEQTGTAVDFSVFLAHNIDGSEVLCIFKKAQKILVGLDISCDKTGVRVRNAFQHQAVSAVPVCATRRSLYDILLLQPDGTMQLWIGLPNVWIPCAVPKDSPAMHNRGPKSAKRGRGSWTDDHGLGISSSASSKLFSGSSTLFRSPSRSSHVVDLRDAVDNRLNIILSNDLVFRAFVNFIPRSTLVRSCITALSYAMPSDLFFNFHVRFLEYEYGHEAKYGGSFSAGDEWEDFVVILLSFCHPSPGEAVNVVTTDVSEDDLEEGDDWEFMMSSEHHRRALNDPALRALNTDLKNSAASPKIDSTLTRWFSKSKEVFLRYHKQSGLFDYFHSVLLALHLVYEDLKLSVITQKYVSDLSPILVQLARFLGWDTWIDYYARQGSDIGLLRLVEVLQVDTDSKFEELKSSPPDINRWIYDRIRQRNPALFWNVTHIPRMMEFLADGILREFTCCEQTRKICLFYMALTNAHRGPEAVILEMVREGFRLCDLHSVPFGVALPLREAIRRCRNSPPGNWPGEAYVLIGREDLAEQILGTPMPVLNVGSLDESKLPKDIQTIAQADQSADVANSKEDGTEIIMSEVTDLRFGMDLRIEEVQRLLQSAKPVKLRITERPELSEQDLAIEHQVHVTALSNRTLSLPVGRGIFTMGTSTAVFMEGFPIPGINLSAKVLPLNAVVALDMHSQPHDLLDWADFHDGVAAGLRISSDCDISGSWILFNKPEELNAQHAGFLLAMGLSGHLRRVASVEWYKYLAQKHDLASIGLLLGLSSAYCGSMDGKVTRLLSIHIPALLPPNSTELYHSALTQTTCVLGMGLLYMGTSHRRMTEVMLAEIGKRELNVSDAVSIHKESYSLAAGFALGFITLGRGNEATGLADLHIKDELRRFMIGGKDEGVRKTVSELKTPVLQTQGWKESENINVNVTSPGATIALGLMFLKTNKVDVASKIDIPDTMVLLDYVRPDFLLLRILSRNLILWNGITPSNNWVEEQVPVFIKAALTKEQEDTDDPNIESVRQAYYHIVAGACFSIAIRYAGSAHERAFQCLLYYLDYFVGLSATPGG
ncbi:hypothetical protein BC938DRAFT_483181 [Jimgerdemannia flammicorona]|uniref:Uncharacterized protein n=1 Tax=Jimgerdemannia flammicorona TaxID=994334 RepID=A0A433QW07_9FUNG|nr:hypothetical protein BC938DRAFT_483181 [Jimgerdemannia flammicorona]